MRKDWQIWGGAVALFAAGVIWSRLFGLYPSDGSWVDAIGLLTALGTLGAAVAAWKAAAKSGDQVALMQDQINLQNNENHHGRFDRLVMDIEQATGLRIVSRWQLYTSLFPNSVIAPDTDVRKVGSLDLEVWRKSYRELSVQAHESPYVDEMAVTQWIQAFFRVTNAMRIEILPRESEQARDRDETLAYGITKNNVSDALRNTGIALQMLSGFCGYRTHLALREPSLDFKRSVRNALNSASKNYELTYSSLPKN